MPRGFLSQPWAIANLAECVRDLERTGQLVTIDVEVDPYLEASAIQRRVYESQGPAVLFRKVKGNVVPYGGKSVRDDRTHAIPVPRHARCGATRGRDEDPSGRNSQASLAIPRRSSGRGASLASDGPARSCPRACDERGPASLTSTHGRGTAGRSSRYLKCIRRTLIVLAWRASNLGMYRVQLSGNRYEANREVGLHYQIHRGIGVHHASAIRRGEALKVNVSVGGPPALTIAAVMPLPEGLPELSLAGLLGGRRLAMVPTPGGLPVPAEADFAIAGTIDPSTQKPEGPFGDHLGYYSLQHDFPVLRVERVYHRPGAIWPFTSVGRPPQEDTSFGAFIHELTGPLIPSVIPGVHAVHAVDAGGRPPALACLGERALRPVCGGPQTPGDPDERQCHPRARPDVAGQVPLDRREGRRSVARHS